MESAQIDITESEINNELARRDLCDFTKVTDSSILFTDFHETYYSILNKFSHGEIKKLIVTIPAQHGKSEGSSRKLPAFMLGKNPDLKIAIGSYSSPFAQDFNKDVQKVIDNPSYTSIFPETTLFGQTTYSSQNVSYLRNSTVFETVGHKGWLRAVGRGGALTGKKVDVMIMDDLYKDDEEANSPIIRKKVIKWYTSVVRKRLHNNSQQLMVFTRWHEGDLIGYLEDNEEVVTVTSFAELEDAIKRDVWIKINFEALKDSPKSEFDKREIGEALWSEMHNKEKHEGDRKLDPIQFECMSQGNPSSKEGRLYSDFKTYTKLPERIIKKANYTDTADTGTDYLNSVCYDVGEDGYIYVTDMIYTQEAMESTEPSTANMLDRNNTRIAKVESNNGGRGFARAVEKLVNICKIVWFHQGNNKESRIITNSPTVSKWIVFPHDWIERWPVYASHLMNYKRLFKANGHDDAPDVLTGIIETEKAVKKFKSKWN